MAEAAKEQGLQVESCADISSRIASVLADGQLIARFAGAMEWGPRALGNRSVLAATQDRGVVQRLNNCLKRSEFMPFAPAVLAEDADSYFEGLDKARHSAEFMTTCFNATAKMREEHPAVVHVDGTVRPQLVRRENNPGFHDVLSAFRRLTGSGVLLNTSFNIHEEPIVRTPREAVRSFLEAKLDYLTMGPLLIHR